MTLKDQSLEIIKQFSGQLNTLTIPRPYIAMTGSLEAALLLSQIVYWSDRTSMKDGWFAKTYGEWEAELTLSQYQVSKAVKALKEFGVETKVKKFKDVPTLHYRVNQPVFLNRVMKFFNNPGDMKKLDNPLTEPTEPTKTIAPSGAAVRKSEKKPRPRNLIFDAVALGSFDLADASEDKTAGARIGKIVSWLKQNAPDVTPERVEAFYSWYADENGDASAPRDAGKFAEWWLKFEGAEDADSGIFDSMFAHDQIVGDAPWLKNGGSQ